MSIEPGGTIGPYAIDQEIGRGGMGVVYLGHDTRLDRAVAIKSLPEHLAQDPDRLARFEREAKTLASLTHPNVAGIYGVEEHEGARYLVLEFVEGETLAERLDRGPMPLDEALDMAVQIAAGVEAAHEAGVVHRDLKPDNIKITPDGAIKVLDFGLAKSSDTTNSSASSTNLPTVTSPAILTSPTIPGAIMGTAPYMSPEQARGRSVDKRSDIWSFGVILYEMLTNASPFRGETVSDSIGAILHKDPDRALLPPETPRAVRRVLDRCLDRDKNKRLRDIGDARIEIEHALATHSIDEHLSHGGRRGARSQLPAILLILLLAIGGAYAAWTAWLTPEQSPALLRVLVDAGSDNQIKAINNGNFAISPDGRLLAFVAGESNQQESLYVRQFDQLEATRLAGTAGAMQPFFSPDGQWIGFFANGSIKKVAVSGGSPLTLCETGGQPRGASWGDDGMIVFTHGTTDGLSRVPDSGGAVEPISELDEAARERSHRWPEVLPGSKAVLFTVQAMGTGFDEANIEVIDLETGDRTVLHHGASNPRYAASGHILFGHNGTLYAAPFDAKRLKMLGQPSPVIEGVVTEPNNGGVHAAVSSSGTLVLNTGEITSDSRLLVWADREGNLEPIDPIERDLSMAAVSPDGSRLALMVSADGQATLDIWTYEIERQVLSRLTFSEGNEFQPVWSPDGKRIVYAANNTGNPPSLFVKNADGSDAPTRLTTSDDAQFPTDWSPDGATVLFSEQGGADQGWNLTTIDMTQDPPTKTVFLDTPFDENSGTFSPNGRWVAYRSNESGRSEIYVRAYPGPGGRWQVSTAGGIQPRWSPNGDEIAYINDGSVWSTPVVSDGEAFGVGRPVELFSIAPSGTFWYPQISFMPDGERFVMLQDTGATRNDDLRQFTVIFNWFEELQSLVGKGGN